MLITIDRFDIHSGTERSTDFYDKTSFPNANDITKPDRKILKPEIGWTLYATVINQSCLEPPAAADIRISRWISVRQKSAEKYG